MANKQVTTEFGTYHLAHNPSAYQPVRTNNFRFIVNGLDKLLKVGGNEEIAEDYFYNAQEVLDFSVISFDAPHFRQEPIEVNRGNSAIKFAGKAKYGDTTLVINDFAGANGKSILEAWQALAYDPVNDTINSSDKYKVDAVVLEYLPDNTLVRYWELIGCWVSGLDEDGWNNDSANKKTVKATITYDYAIPHQPDEL